MRKQGMRIHTFFEHEMYLRVTTLKSEILGNNVKSNMRKK